MPVERTERLEQRLARAQLHPDLRRLGPDGGLVRAAERRDAQGTEAVHDGGRRPGDQGHPGAGEVPDRDGGARLRPGREELLVLPQEEPHTAVLPQPQRGEWVGGFRWFDGVVLVLCKG